MPAILQGALYVFSCFSWESLSKVGFLICFPGEETEAQRDLTPSPLQGLVVHQAGRLVVLVFLANRATSGAQFQTGSLQTCPLVVVTPSVSNRQRTGDESVCRCMWCMQVGVS